MRAASAQDGRAPVPAGAVPAGAARDGRASVPAGAVLAGTAQSMGDALIAGVVPAGAARDGRASVPAGAVLAGAAQSMGDALIEVPRATAAHRYPQMPCWPAPRNPWATRSFFYFFFLSFFFSKNLNTLSPQTPTHTAQAHSTHTKSIFLLNIILMNYRYRALRCC